MMAEIQKNLTGMVSRMMAQLEVRIVEIVLLRLAVMEVFMTSNHQKTMMMFTAVMTKVTTM